MAYKPLDEIADAFFHEDRPSVIEEPGALSPNTWRKWGYFLTAKQGAWLQGQAAREDRLESFHGGKPFMRGSFKRNGVEYGWDAGGVGRNNQLMFHVILKIN